MTESISHTVKAFDDDLEELRALVAELGGHAEAAISGAMHALVQRDTGAALEIIGHDRKIDALAEEVERRGVRLIALRAPRADDLREVLASLKIADVVERIGDYAKNIARRVSLVGRSGSGLQPSLLPVMSGAAFDMVRAALDAFVGRDPAAAARVVELSGSISDLYDDLFRASLAEMVKDPHGITTSTHLLFVAQSLERIGDHAAEMARIVYYAATGRPLAEPEAPDPILAASA